MALRCIYCGAPSEYAPARWWQRREWRVLRHVCPVPKRERRTLYDDVRAGRYDQPHP